MSAEDALSCLKNGIFKRLINISTYSLVYSANTSSEKTSIQDFVFCAMSIPYFREFWLPRFATLLQAVRETFYFPRESNTGAKQPTLFCYSSYSVLLWVAWKAWFSNLNMQKILNKDLSEKRDTLKKISNYMPVNYDCMQSLSLWQ